MGWIGNQLTTSISNTENLYKLNFEFYLSRANSSVTLNQID
jgi:hypothetical protein